MPETSAVTRIVSLHLTDTGRDSIRGVCERLKSLTEMYRKMNAPEIATTMSDMRELLELLTDGTVDHYLIDVGGGLHGYVEPGRD